MKRQSNGDQLSSCALFAINRLHLAIGLGRGWKIEDGCLAADVHDRLDALQVHYREIIQRCQIGDRDAQRQLFEQTSPRIYRLLMRMTGNTQDASDLTQETYFKAFRSVEQFHERAAVTSWLYRIAVNEALQYQRKRHTSISRLHAVALTKPAGTESLDFDVQLDVQDALHNLPPDDRMILLLRYQEDLDYRQIAHVLGCADGTVASRLNRARDRLRNVLGKSYGRAEEKLAPRHPTMRMRGSDGGVGSSADGEQR